jgi:hypothetical protein
MLGERDNAIIEYFRNVRAFLNRAYRNRSGLLQCVYISWSTVTSSSRHLALYDLHIYADVIPTAHELVFANRSPGDRRVSYRNQLFGARGWN